MADKKRLGELLLEAGLIDRKTLGTALELQSAGRRRLGYLLVRMGYLSEDDLQATLSRQLGMPLINVEQLFNKDVKKILPRSVCRQYTILPLRPAEHNILDLAMVDPSDEEAVTFVEELTGKVVRANLARHSDIEEAISRYIPWSLRDIFIPVNTMKLLVLTLIAISLLAAIIFVKLNNTQNRLQFGIRRTTQTGIEVKNHDLSVFFRNDGAIIFKGYGKHAEGNYNIVFNDLQLFKNFILNKKNNFSQQQWTWLQWVIDNRNTNSR
jgi:hypothetical protein